ncbi:MAG: 30S ribosomal protein S6 [Clostridiales bacterium]|jgi:small subunit ribosomal protein S6|nr:30S ribosomal protein S6 [Clostridiales bacterium]
MNKYEVLYIIDASADDATKEAQIAKYSDLVTAAGGTVDAIDKWGIKKFAYPMEFKNEGYYVLMTFSAPAELPAEMERQMRISDSIIRYLVIRK